MFWPPHDEFPYDEPFGLPRERERLRHLVFLDGRLIDTWTQSVEATAYRSIAEEFDREKRMPRFDPEPLPPPYERVLTWLDVVVGGRIALLALDDEPRQEAPTIENDGITPFLERVAEELFDGEFLIAARAALATVSRDDPDLLLQAPAGDIAATLCWVVGRANGLVGAGTPVTQKVLKGVLWVSSSPTRRVSRIRSCLRGLMAAEPGHRPSECPDLLELGSPAYLTSATRRRLIGLRDQALATAEQSEADHQAREALRGGG